MTKQDFIDYLVAHDCEIVRIANQGYHVMRNTKNKKMSGVPVTDPPLPATVCRICKTLDIPTPDAAHSAQAIIDAAHKQFNEE
jgi:hypothetical protein